MALHAIQNASTTAALLEYGAKVDLTAADGLTPLHEAVGEGSIAVAEILVRAGARVSDPVEDVHPCKTCFCPKKQFNMEGLEHIN